MTKEELILIENAILQVGQIEPNLIIVETALKIIDNELQKL